MIHLFSIQRRSSRLFARTPFSSLISLLSALSWSTSPRTYQFYGLGVGVQAFLPLAIAPIRTVRASAGSVFRAVTTCPLGSLAMTTSSSASPSSSVEQAKDESLMTEDSRKKDETKEEEDPYLWLEQVESEESLAFAKAANEACLQALGHPEQSTTDTYARILAVLESDDRIPHVTQLGVVMDEVDTTPAASRALLYNFWKDAAHPKGLWRKTVGLDSYRKDQPEWITVLDVDALAEQDGISWVWHGYRPLPRSRDPVHSPHAVTRALLSLSRGGSDAVHVKEFDLETAAFVTDQPFVLPEAKSRVSYKSRNVLLVGTDFGPDSLTDSGYPRTIREWVRGTDLADAPVIFEGDRKDVSVSVSIVDERVNGGDIYELCSRSLTFYTSKYWIRKIQFEHLLAPDDPARVSCPEPLPEFVPVPVQDDANVNFLGNLMIISLRSDWEPVEGQQVFKKGSLVYVLTDDFLAKGPANCQYSILFEPTERTAYEYYTSTKNYLVLATMDNVKSKLDFYKISSDGTSLTLVSGTSNEARIRACSVQPIDPYSGSDEFWYTSSDFVTPSTLYLANAAQVEAAGSSDPEVFITERLKALPPQYNADDIEFAQQTATSKDGTQIPYFIIKKKDLVLDGKNPTLLYGYGGFEVSLGPHYIATAGLAWLERGGVYVEANIRGGGEFGPAWHQAALKEKRHKAYEDFIAVAEHLIASHICRPKTLAIRGGSNGGLLMGNMYIMRPDLFGAIHCAVPLLDMKRYHTLLAGASWMAEYGNPETEDWAFLKDYSPYHNVDPTVEYPPILVTTSTRDDRVHPGHARKFVKKLWDLGQGRWPVFYYENIEGGHGGAADAKQSAFMTALAYDFMFDTLHRNAQAVG